MEKVEKNRKRSGLERASGTKRSVVVHIHGQRYLIRSDADESYVQKLAGYVNDRIMEVQNTSKPTSPQSLTMLAALNIADELFREQRRRAELKDRIREKSTVVMTLLDQEVARHLPGHN